MVSDHAHPFLFQAEVSLLLQALSIHLRARRYHRLHICSLHSDSSGSDGIRDLFLQKAVKKMAYPVRQLRVLYVHIPVSREQRHHAFCILQNKSYHLAQQPLLQVKALKNHTLRQWQLLSHVFWSVCLHRAYC